MSSLSLQQARAQLAAHFSRTPIETRSLGDSVGLVTAHALHTDMDFPPFHRVAMDGYAVRAAETEGASPSTPIRLRVVGSARAGAPFDGVVEAGACTKAMTGAALPSDLDAVVPIEKTAGYSDEFAEILIEARAGQHVAKRAEDLRSGELVLEAGVRIRPQHLQALASAGHATVAVHRPPTCAVLATGDELVAADRRPTAGQIRESNSHTIVSLLKRYGVDAKRQITAADDPAALRMLLAELLDAFDLVVLSGGVSKGEHDYVKEALRDAGVRLHFESLLLRPGHPTTFGSRDDVAVFALPGNPVAVAATLMVVFDPGMRTWTGEQQLPRRQFAVLNFEHRRRGVREQLMPVRLVAPGTDGLPKAEQTGHHGSGDFMSLARADAFAHFPIDRELFPRGELVEIYPFEGSH